MAEYFSQSQINIFCHFPYLWLRFFRFWEKPSSISFYSPPPPQVPAPLKVIQVSTTNLLLLSKIFLIRYPPPFFCAYLELQSSVQCANNFTQLDVIFGLVLCEQIKSTYFKKDFHLQFFRIKNAFRSFRYLVIHSFMAKL